METKGDLNKYKVSTGAGFKLEKFDTGPGKTPVFGKNEWLDVLERNKLILQEEQSKLYAESKQGVLIIFQSMDGGGKDSAIKHIMGVNPQGVDVSSFKQPSNGELARDFLWRYMIKAPVRGMIEIFNRSYYEEVLVVKVHELYKQRKIKKQFQSKECFERRYGHIVNYEDYLADNGIKIIKVFLNLSADEQRKRFLRRIDRPDKNWKFSDADLKERGYWDRYRQAFSEAIKKTSTEVNPWWVVPADNKRYTRAVISSIIAGELQGLGAEYPKMSVSHLKQLEEARIKLEDCGIV